MTFKALSKHRLFRPATGATLAALLGLALWKAPFGEAWANASYDHLFRFGARRITNQVALILMDNDAHSEFGQVRGQPWNRRLHADLVNRLAKDNCPLVVFDVFFRAPGDPATDAALAEAMSKLRQVVLMSKPTNVVHRSVAGEQAVQPTEPFLSAARKTSGVAFLETNQLDGITRRHWPFPSPGSHSSLPEVAARLAGVQVSEAKQERWVRYYGCGREAPWTYLSYGQSLRMTNGYFREKIVFIGSEPQKPEDATFTEDDKFRTPYTRWTGESVGGVEILATEFLNLLNRDWMRRPSPWVEVLVLLGSGVLIGGGLCRVRLRWAWIASAGILLAVTLGAASLSYFTHFWFPWLVLAGGQLPIALAWAIVTVVFYPKRKVAMKPAMSPESADASDFERFGPPFGEGGFGKVWVVRNAIGQWQALKQVYRANFGDETDKYEMEFKGVQKYKPISHKHPGLLRIEFVSKVKQGGYFYYVMELGDPLDPDCGWEENPSLYRPLDLKSHCARAERKRLPPRECVEIGIRLADALEFLHQQGLTHRDIKPGNVIFVNGHPKLADVGTVTVLRPAEQINTRVLSRGYTPPPDEPSGTRQADIYSLGKLLYAISTGRNPEEDFPTLSTTLVESTSDATFMRLNRIILKACQPDLEQRYPSAAEVRKELLALLEVTS